MTFFACCLELFFIQFAPHPNEGQTRCIVCNSPLELKRAEMFCWIAQRSSPVCLDCFFFFFFQEDLIQQEVKRCFETELHMFTQFSDSLSQVYVPPSRAHVLKSNMRFCAQVQKKPKKNRIIANRTVRCTMRALRGTCSVYLQ